MWMFTALVNASRPVRSANGPRAWACWLRLTTREFCASASVITWSGARVCPSTPPRFAFSQARRLASGMLIPGGVTVIVKVAEPVREPASVTVTVTRAAPWAVGVPETTPEVSSIESPAGSLVALQV